MVSVTTTLPNADHPLVSNPSGISSLQSTNVPIGNLDTPDLWASVFAALPIPAVLVSPAGFIMASNHALEEISELTGATLIGHPWRWLVDPLERVTGESLPPRTDNQWLGTLHAARRDRQISVRSAPLAPILASESGPAPILYLIETIEETERDISIPRPASRIPELMAEPHVPHLLDVAHELRSPLQSFSLAIAELIDENIALSDDNRRRLFNVLGRSAVHLQTLIENLLDAASIGASEFSIALRPTDLAEIIEEAVLVVDPLLQPQGQTISVMLPPEPLIVQADPQRLRQVLVNLLVNAIKYGPAHGVITVRARSNAAMTVVEIEDRGVGISDVEQARLFDRYFRGKATQAQSDGAAADKPGMGLGLAICKAIVRAHGGTIGVRSIPGHGATVWFTLQGRVACAS